MKNYIMKRGEQTRFDSMCELAGIDSIMNKKLMLSLVEQHGKEKVNAALKELCKRVDILNPLKSLFIKLKAKK